MCDRKGRVVCTFCKESPNISAFDIHEWVNKHRRMDENAVTTIQIDRPKRQVFVNLHRHIRYRHYLTAQKVQRYITVEQVGYLGSVFAPPAGAGGSSE